MVTTSITLHSLEDARRFVQICSEQKFNIDLVAGSSVVHAKSIIGVLSMDFTQPMQVQVTSGETAAVDGFFQKIALFSECTQKKTP